MDRLNGFPLPLLDPNGCLALLLFPKVGSRHVVSLRGFRGVPGENEGQIVFTVIPPEQDNVRGKLMRSFFLQPQKTYIFGMIAMRFLGLSGTQSLSHGCPLGLYESVW